MANDPSEPDAGGGQPNVERAAQPGTADPQVRESQGAVGEQRTHPDSAPDPQQDVTAEIPASEVWSGPAPHAGGSSASDSTQTSPPQPGPSGPGAGVPGGGWRAGPEEVPSEGRTMPDAPANAALDTAPNVTVPGSDRGGSAGDQGQVRNDPPAWYGGAHGMGRPPAQPVGGPARHAMGTDDPRYPWPGAPGPVLDAPPMPAPHPYPPVGHRRGSTHWGVLVGFGLVAVLLAGVIGGVVGNALAGREESIGALGQPPPGIDEAAPPTAVEAVARRVLPSVVQLRVEAPDATGEGSAMVLSADGLLLTNNHVVAAAADSGTITAVFHNGATANARIVGRDPRSDLAVLRADGVSGLDPVELGNSDSVRVGQQVVAFGAPLGLGGTVTTGIISAVDRAVNVGEEIGAGAPTVLNALQTDAAINPGNSGGPLVDMQGRVIGINSAIATTGGQGGSIGVGFSIPANQARRIAEELERTGRASWAVLGVTVADHPKQTGAIVRGVTPGGAAELAGIRPGDVVVRFGDQRISSGVDLQAAVGSHAPGEVVEVQLADRTVQARLTAAPE